MGRGRGEALRAGRGCGEGEGERGERCERRALSRSPWLVAFGALLESPDKVLALGDQLSFTLGEPHVVAAPKQVAFLWRRPPPSFVHLLVVAGGVRKGEGEGGEGRSVWEG